MMSNLLLSLWWLAENGLVNYLVFDFLLDVTRTDGRGCLPIWFAANGAATLTVIFFRPPAAFLFSVLLLGAFAGAVLKIPGPSLVVPMAAVATLCTLKESFSAVLLSWLSVSVSSPTGGIAEQLLVPLLLDALLFAAMRTLRMRYPHEMARLLPAYPHTLLPACVFAVFAIRWGLRLDSSDFEPYLAAFGIHARLFALFALAGAVSIVFAAFGTFCRMTRLLGQEKRLENQLTAANERNRAYAAFQHDIYNHLLVLSGLLREKSFIQAEQYADQLKASSGPLLGGASTGNPALNVLLGEKLSAAKRSHITTSCDVRIPDGFHVNDMDLCALFSNILDNAIAACLKEPEDGRFLSLSAKAKSQLLVIEAVNGTSAGGPVVFGTGLHNVRHIAERCHGTMETQLSDGRFRISVLLYSQ